MHFVEFFFIGIIDWKGYVVKHNYDIVVFDYISFPVFTRTTRMAHFQDIIGSVTAYFGQ